MKKTLLCAILAVSLWDATASAAPKKAGHEQKEQVVATKYGWLAEVRDGNSFDLTTTSGSTYKVRLYGIDAPTFPHDSAKGRSYGQPFSFESRNALRNILSKAKMIRVDVIWNDYGGNVWGVAYVNNTDVAMELLKTGYTEAYLEYLREPYRTWYLNMEVHAKISRLGIWGAKEYERPSDFRRRMKLGEFANK